MQPTEEKQSLRCDNILVTPRGIAETSGKKVMIFIPSAEVQHITLKHGRSDHRPLFSLTVGLMLALVGFFGLIEFFFAPRGFRYELAIMAFGVIGVSLIYDALKQRHFLEVQSSKGLRRLVLSKHAKKNDIQTFCQSVRTIYKYDITDAA